MLRSQLRWRSPLLILAITLLMLSLLVPLVGNVAYAQEGDQPTEEQVPPVEGEEEEGDFVEVMADENANDQFFDLMVEDEFGNKIPMMAPDEIIGNVSLDEFTGTDEEKLLKAQLATVLQVQVPPLIDNIEDKVLRGNERKMTWLIWILIVIIPAVGFLATLLFPLMRGKAIRARAPGASTGAMMGLYFKAALAVGVVLLALGGFLTAVQYVMGELSFVTNPQIILQEAIVDYISDEDNSVWLVDNYYDAFAGLANDVAADDDGAMLAVMLDNVLTIKQNGVLNVTADIVRFIMPALGYLFYITLGIAVLLFLKRLIPDLKKLMLSPVEVLEAREKGGTLSGPGMGAQATRLIKIEFGAVILFGLTVFGLSFLMGAALYWFCTAFADVFVNGMGLGMIVFLDTEGAANYLVAQIYLMNIFIVEIIVLFIVGFVFLNGNLMLLYRKLFAGELSPAETWKVALRYLLRFTYYLALAAGLGWLASWASNEVLEILISGNEDSDAAWLWAIVAIPVVLIILLNLGMWLLKGFRTLKRTKAKDAELQEPKAEPIVAPAQPAAGAA